MIRKWIAVSRFYFGRELIEIGIAIMPSGRAKRELTQMLEDWTEHVYRTIGANYEATP